MRGDLKTSLLYRGNQMHAATNIFVCEGSFMTSKACIKPSLGYIFMARATGDAVEALKIIFYRNG